MLGGVVTLFHNHAVTGSFSTLPYRESQHQYGVPQGPLWEQMLAPVTLPSVNQQIVYERQRRQRETWEKTAPLQRYWSRGTEIARFFLPKWFILPFIVSLTMLDDALVLAALALVLGACWFGGFYLFFFPHYFAAYAGAIAFLLIRGLQRISVFTTLSARRRAVRCGVDGCRGPAACPAAAAGRTGYEHDRRERASSSNSKPDEISGSYLFGITVTLLFSRNGSSTAPISTRTPSSGLA